MFVDQLFPFVFPEGDQLLRSGMLQSVILLINSGLQFKIKLFESFVEVDRNHACGFVAGGRLVLILVDGNGFFLCLGFVDC